MSAPAEKYNNKTDKLCLSYCCCYYSYCDPVSCHFPISLQLLHRLKDLRIFEPIAQLLFHSTLKAYHQLNSALKQNRSMSRCGYSVLWSINRNSKARRIDQLNYRIQGLSFPYHWVTKARRTVICLPQQQPLSNLHMLALRGPEFCCCLRWSNTGQIVSEKWTRSSKQWCSICGLILREAWPEESK